MAYSLMKIGMVLFIMGTTETGIRPQMKIKHRKELLVGLVSIVKIESITQRRRNFGYVCFRN